MADTEGFEEFYIATVGRMIGTVKSWLARGRRALAVRLGDPEEVLS